MFQRNVGILWKVIANNKKLVAFYYWVPRFVVSSPISSPYIGVVYEIKITANNKFSHCLQLYKIVFWKIFKSPETFHKLKASKSFLFGNYSTDPKSIIKVFQHLQLYRSHQNIWGEFRINWNYYTIKEFHNLDLIDNLCQLFKTINSWQFNLIPYQYCVTS